jgi:hypothetical protein
VTLSWIGGGPPYSRREIGTPGSDFALRMVSEVLTLATLGAAVNFSVKKV